MQWNDTKAVAKHYVSLLSTTTTLPVVLLRKEQLEYVTLVTLPALRNVIAKSNLSLHKLKRDSMHTEIDLGPFYETHRW